MADKTELLAVAVASGSTVREAAAQLQIPERTAYRRSADPGFRKRVADMRSEMFAGAFGKLAHVASAAAETLRTLLGSPNESVRLGAARAILEMAGRLRESVDLEARLAELERKYEQREKAKKAA